MATLTALSLYIGDDWTISIKVQDGTGTPVNLSGFVLSALFFPAYAAVPLPLAGANGAVTVTDAANGAVTILATRAATQGATAQGTSKIYGNRIQVIATDAAGHQRTLGIILIAPVAP